MESDQLIFWTKSGTFFGPKYFFAGNYVAVASKVIYNIFIQIKCLDQGWMMFCGAEDLIWHLPVFPSTFSLICRTLEKLQLSNNYFQATEEQELRSGAAVLLCITLHLHNHIWFHLYQRTRLTLNYCFVSSQLSLCKQDLKAEILLKMNKKPTAAAAAASWSLWSL